MPSPTLKFFAPAWPHLRAFDAWAAPLVKHAVADHLCYHCSSHEEYERLRAMFEPDSRFMHQAWISGRRIAVIRFNLPLGTALGFIRVLELSDQKPDGSQTSRFDHVEIYPRTGGIEELALIVAGIGTELKLSAKAHHTTYDARLADGFRVRLEPEALLTKIAREEMT
ncbi:MAG: YecM protein [Candidatus Parcubacteria bacterium]|jgi:hypothetical protein